ncbi:MAG TPA: tRNA pseudouridine(55) synthase TruB [Gemmatimonadales bacterium]|nr:tRNA pseudouridine(55) synthase TruB [Gemmatimonadales bacterium]HRX19116.1 tRNA pseudouridine(55) synthase TruB [Gemmatimonadales bacterium]
MDKPIGWTSHDVVAVVRRRLGVRAVGHAGTLDPFATGLLVVLVGRATRLARFVEATAKAYDAVIRFGAATDTDDATGTVVRTLAPDTWPDVAAIDGALAARCGVRPQRPPAYSAKHVAGRRSHALARAGIAVELLPVAVQVHELARRGWDPPDLAVHAVVGKGTYLRAIARDLGEDLGIPAHCAELRRTRVGPFSVEAAASPESVEPDHLLPPAAMVAHLEQVTVSDTEVRELGFGRSIGRQADGEGPAALVAVDGRLVAVAEAADGSRWQPVVVLEPAA